MEQTLTAQRLKALHEEWRQHPPLPILVAAWLGIKPQEYGKAEELIDKLATVPGVKHV